MLSGATFDPEEAALFEYQTLFDARGALYNRANVRFPEARAQEARAILRHLDLGPGTAWLDVSAGGGYLSRRAETLGLPPARVSCDGSLPFLVSSASPGASCVTRAESLPFSDRRFGGVACLAALHHSEDPEALCGELLRVTVRGSRAAVGDVANGSRAARFLNAFVDRHTSSGHHGRFHGLEALSEFFRAAEGIGIRAESADVEWRLPSRSDAVEFCRDLFGLEPSADDAAMGAALDDLGAREGEEDFRIPWRMHYVSAARS